MHILHLALGFPPAYDLGGPVRNLYSLSRHLVEQGNQVTVCCTDLKDKYHRLENEKKYEVVDGISVYRLPTGRLHLGNSHSFGIYYCKDIWRTVAEDVGNVDVVHIHGYRDFMTLSGSLISMLRKLPYVIHARGVLQTGLTNRLGKRIFDHTAGRLILKNASHAIALSLYEEEEYLNLQPHLKDRITVIPNAIEIEKFSQLPPRGRFRNRWQIGENPMILYLGRLHPLKGINHLVEALVGLPEVYILAVVGPDEGYKAELEALAVQLGVAHRVFFPGAVRDEAWFEALVDADVVAYPSMRDGFGMVPLEAIMCNTPTVLTTSTGAIEWLKQVPGITAVEYGDVPNIRTAIENIVDYPGEAKSIVALARQMITDKLNWHIVTQQVSSVYELAIDYHKRRVQ